MMIFSAKKTYLTAGLSFITLLFIFLQSCEIIDPKSEVPAYLKVQKVHVKTDLLTQGAASQKITDIWASVGNNFLGAYELPAIFPVLASGNQEILLNAGVKENGISATRKIYPFYQTIDTVVDLNKTSTYLLEPTFNYKPETKFGITEGFESGKWKLTPGSTNTAEIDTANISETLPEYGGEHCLKAGLTASQSYFIVISPDIKSIQTGKSAWMEIDFKSDVLIGVGLTAIGYPDENHWVTLNKSTDWNKVYVNFTELISRYPTGTAYRLFLFAEKADVAETEHIFIDNIKFLYFE